jgi:hypothetical protein
MDSLIIINFILVSTGNVYKLLHTTGIFKEDHDILTALQFDPPLPPLVRQFLYLLHGEKKD